MEESCNSLDGWVAYRPNAFDPDVISTHRDIVFVAWNAVDQLFALTITSSHRKASDRLSEAQATCLRYVYNLLLGHDYTALFPPLSRPKNLLDVHRELSLVYPDVSTKFPAKLQSVLEDSNQWLWSR